MMRSGKRKLLGRASRGSRWSGPEDLERRLVLSGLSLFDTQYWHQGLPPVLDVVENGDRYAAALVSGDFNNDDHLDLAVGVPGESLAGVEGVGAVSVLYGGPAGLDAIGNQLWSQRDVWPVVTAGGAFGSALATGDFNGDSFADLAIGMPNADIFDESEAGAVAILYGSRSGLVSTGSQVWHQDVVDIRGDAEAGDHYGAALAVGDFDDNGVDDLAIGVPDDEINGHDQAGGVAVMYGVRGEGLSTAGDQFWHQDITDPREDVAGDAEAGDRFGAALAAGDLDDDGVSDLAIGVPGDEINGQAEAGGVALVFGQRNQSLSPVGNLFLHQDTSGLVGEAEAGDEFGASLVIGHFDNDFFADVAVGIPGQTVNAATDAGAVQILRGSNTGFTAEGSQIWHQGLLGIGQLPQANDRFGASLAAGDVQGVADRTDLLIGVPGEDLGGLPDVGVFHVIQQSADGLTPEEAKIFRPADFGLAEDPNEQFGAALAVGDFNQDNLQDLAVAAPEDRPLFVTSGALLAVYGTEDFVQPTAAVIPHAAQQSPTSDSVIRFEVIFSESVTGFGPEGIVLSGTAGATTVEVSGGGAVYELAVSGMTQSGTVVASVLAGAAMDLSGNPNLPSTNGGNQVDYELPVLVEINQGAGQADPTSEDAIVFDVVFSEPVTDFLPEDVVLSGSALPTTAMVSGAGRNYTVTVSGMTRDGAVVAQIPAGVVEPFNAVSTSLDNEVQYAVPRAPTVTIDQAVNQPDPTDAESINFVAFFSEPVTGFTAEDVVLSGTAGASSVEVTGDGERFTIVVSGMVRDGTVIATIPAGAAIDADETESLASTSDDNLVNYQQQVVTVSINQASGQGDPTSATSILFDVQFSQPVTGFEPSDVLLQGTANANAVSISGSGARYQLAVSGMLQSGSVVALIPAQVVNPPNQASTSTDNRVTYEQRAAPAGWRNTDNPFDVNYDGFVSPRDVLAIIIEINEHQVSDPTGRLPNRITPAPIPPGYVDVNGDGFATPRDALLLINHINGQVALAAHLADDDDDR